MGRFTASAKTVFEKIEERGKLWQKTIFSEFPALDKEGTDFRRVQPRSGSCGARKSGVVGPGLRFPTTPASFAKRVTMLSPPCLRRGILYCTSSPVVVFSKCIISLLFVGSNLPQPRHYSLHTNPAGEKSASFSSNSSLKPPSLAKRRGLFFPLFAREGPGGELI